MTPDTQVLATWALYFALFIAPFLQEDAAVIGSASAASMHEGDAAAIEASDLTLVSGDLRGAADAIRLSRRTLGIVGLGNIGKKVARMAKGFGMRVQYYDIQRLTEDQEDALGVKFRLLRELLRTSDVVSLNVPLNASTRHMIGAPELALLKPHAILVNTCRGPVIDEPALVKALSANKLFGAGLDVFDQEPPPADNPTM